MVELANDTEVGLRLQVGRFVAPDGLDVMAHARATVPENPPEPSTITSAVFPVVAPAATVTFVPKRVNEGAVTVTTVLALLLE